MKNGKIYQQLQRIIETSLSPKRKTKLNTTRLLYNPNISLPSIKNIQNNGMHDFKSKNNKMNFISKNEQKQFIVRQIERKKIELQPSLTAWQVRQNSFSNSNFGDIMPKNQQENVQQIISKLCKVCLSFALKYGKNYKLLQIVMLQSQGRRGMAISKMLQWLLGWVKSLFSIFSNIINKKIQHL